MHKPNNENVKAEKLPRFNNWHLDIRLNGHNPVIYLPERHNSK